MAEPLDKAKHVLHDVEHPIETAKALEQEAAEGESERTPLRRVAAPADQARVICFLASADADFVTGLTIDVTGGL